MSQQSPGGAGVQPPDQPPNSDNSAYGQYPYAPSRKKRHWVRNTFIGLGAFIVLIIVIVVLVAALGGPKTTKVSNSAAPSVTSPSQSATSASPTASAPLTASIGGTFKVTDSSGNIYDVTLVRVIDPAQGSDQFNQPNNGERFVAAVFRVTGVSGTASDDSNSDAMLTGANQQVYQPDFDSVAGYTNFNGGDFNVTPDQSETGAVTFQVPIGVKVSNIQWTLEFGSSTATWTAG